MLHNDKTWEIINQPSIQQLCYVHGLQLVIQDDCLQLKDALFIILVMVRIVPPLNYETRAVPVMQTAQVKSGQHLFSPGQPSKIY